MKKKKPKGTMMNEAQMQIQLEQDYSSSQTAKRQTGGLGFFVTIQKIQTDLATTQNLHCVLLHTFSFCFVQQ